VIIRCDSAAMVSNTSELLPEPEMPVNTVRFTWRGIAQCVRAHLPDAVTEPLLKKVGLDRLAAIYTAIETVRRGGTVSLSGV
jgi:hypothetical protein